MTRHPVSIPVCLALCGVLSCQHSLVAASAGDRDPAFGNGGIAVADLADSGFGRNGSSLFQIRTQADGRIIGLGLAAGGGFVARWNANGTLDTTFGLQGVSVLPGFVKRESSVVKPFGLTLLPDGRILVGATLSPSRVNTYSDDFIGIWRLGANGLPDLTWNGGRPFIDSTAGVSSYFSACAGVHPRADGSVLAVVDRGDGLTVIKLTAAGTLDTSFATAGIRRLPIPNTEYIQVLRSVGLPDGNILVTGSISRPPNGNAGDGAFVVRLTAAGDFDTTFDGDGYTIFKFGTPPDAEDQLSSWRGQDIALQSNGAILISGSSYYGGSDKKNQSCVVRLTPSGAIDTTFGTLFSGVSYGFIFNGKNNSPDMAEGILVQGDDRIITGGWYFPSGYVARHTADGRTRQFEVAPPTVAQGGLPGYWIHGLALQGDGGIIAAGEAVTADNDNRSLLIRVTPAGARDTTFGGAAPGLGAQPTARSFDAASELILADDKPVVAAAVTLDTTSGNYVTLAGLARFTAAGSPDTTFSGDGRLTFRLGDPSVNQVLVEVPADLTRDGQGRLLVVGPATSYDPNQGTYSQPFVSVRRFLADGSADTSFASGGRAQFTIKDSTSVVSAVAVQADDKPLVIAGAQGSPGKEILLRRLTVAGAADTTFNGTGSVNLTTAFALAGGYNQGDPINARGIGVAVTADGKILVGGRPVTSGTNPKELQVARFTSAGTLDTSFGTSGLATVDLGTATGADNGYRFRRLRQLADGRILLLAEGFVVRLTAAGALDTTFNGTGILAINPTARVDTLAGVAETGGKLIVVGTVGIDTTAPRIRVSRHLADGSLDPAFGNAGVVDRDFGEAADVEIQSDGGIVVAASSDNDVAVFRYLPSGTSAPIAILADRTSLGVSEGSVGTLGVRLGSAPSGTVTVTAALAGGGDPDLLVTGGASLTFTAANWNIFQAVTVTAQADADTTNGSATLVLSASGLTSDAVAVSEIDDGRSPVQLLSPTSLIVAEGASASLPVRLTAAPSANVVVAAAIQSGADLDLTVSGGASLTFTPSNWNTPQNVTIAAAADADTANGTANLRLSASGLLDTFVAITESDAGTPPVASIAATGYATEGGATGSFVISLSKSATSSLTLGFVVDAGGTASPSDYTLNRTSPVTIAAGQTSATITVTATADALNEGTETLRVNLSAGSGYTLAGTLNQAVVSIRDGASTGNQPPVITISGATETVLVLP